MRPEKTRLRFLLVCALLELVVLFALSTQGVEGFATFVSTPDTLEYNRLAQELAAGHIVASVRTLGYPLFLSAGYLLGGTQYGMYWAIAAQLLLNLVLTAMSWRLVDKLAPETPRATKLALTGFFFLAGLGMSLYLLSDLLASFFFGVFLFGFLYWRSWEGTLVTGAALAVATLVRPSFVLIPVLLPAAAYLVRRCGSAIPWPQVLTLIVVSSTGSALNIWYQQQYNGYFGPSPIVAQNLERVLYAATAKGNRDPDEFLKAFESESSQRMGGVPYEFLSETQRESAARAIFLEQFKVHAPGIVILTGTTFVKYLLVPVESILARLTTLAASEATYERYIRPVVGLLCLPIWILCLIPPRGQLAQRRWYYCLVLLMWVYLAGITALNPAQGERIRFPILAFLVPIAAWNIQTGLAYLARLAEPLRQEKGLSGIQ
jgi:hypothetical protein